MLARMHDLAIEEVQRAVECNASNTLAYVASRCRQPPARPLPCTRDGRSNPKVCGPAMAFRPAGSRFCAGTRLQCNLRILRQGCCCASVPLVKGSKRKEAVGAVGLGWVDSPHCPTAAAVVPDASSAKTYRGGNCNFDHNNRVAGSANGV